MSEAWIPLLMWAAGFVTGFAIRHFPDEWRRMFISWRKTKRAFRALRRSASVSVDEVAGTTPETTA